jgi:hypothetical protein
MGCESYGFHVSLLFDAVVDPLDFVHPTSPPLDALSKFQFAGPPRPAVIPPQELHIASKSIPRWSTKWIWLQALSVFCFCISLAAAIGSIEYVVQDLKVRPGRKYLPSSMEKKNYNEGW